MQTKKWVAGIAAVALAATLASCSSSPEPGDSDPIVLSVLGPLSGANADTGLNIQQGAQVAINQINEAGGVLGRQLAMESKDTAQGAQQAAQAIRDFAAEDKLLFLGELSSANCLSDAPIIEELGGVFVITTCTNDALTGENGGEAPFQRTFRTGATSLQDMIAIYKAIHQEFPDITDWDIFAFDYVSGRLQWDQFSEGYAKLGGSIDIANEYWVPLDQQNYGSQVSALSSGVVGAEKRGLYLGTYGAGTASFLQQALPYDFLSQYDVIVNPGSYYPIARNFGGTAPDVWNGYDYNYTAYDTAENAKFVADFEKLTGKKPDAWGYQAYLGVLAYAAAIEKAGSADPDAVVAAMKGISFPSPQGTFTIDATTHQGSANIVLTHTVGNSNAPEGVEVKNFVLVEYEDTLQP